MRVQSPIYHVFQMPNLERSDGQRLVVGWGGEPSLVWPPIGAHGTSYSLGDFAGRLPHPPPVLVLVAGTVVLLRRCPHRPPQPTDSGALSLCRRVVDGPFLFLWELVWIWP